LLPVVTTWMAVLVVTDNCTRQCLGLPLFVAGSHVTAEMVVAALRVLLPANLQFLISDRGVHFTAQVFQQLATEANFVHVVIARHRPSLMELRNVLSEQSKNGWLTKSGHLTKNYWNFWHVFTRVQ